MEINDYNDIPSEVAYEIAQAIRGLQTVLCDNECVANGNTGLSKGERSKLLKQGQKVLLKVMAEV